MSKSRNIALINDVQRQNLCKYLRVWGMRTKFMFCLFVGRVDFQCSVCSCDKSCLDRFTRRTHVLKVHDPISQNGVFYINDVSEDDDLSPRCFDFKFQLKQSNHLDG